MISQTDVTMMMMMMMMMMIITIIWRKHLQSLSPAKWSKRNWNRNVPSSNLSRGTKYTDWRTLMNFLCLSRGTEPQTKT